MIRRSFRRGLTLGLIGGAAITALRFLRPRQPAAEPALPALWPPIRDTTSVIVPVPEAALDVKVAPGPDPQPERPATAPVRAPAPAAETARPAKPATKKAAGKKATAPKRKITPPAPWVESVEGACPVSHPVKGKLTSRIFHIPGGLSYERTHADRCYLDATAAEADGLRQSKR